MAYNAKAVANYFLDVAASHKTSLTPMKLQKLIFFAHGWHLALCDEPLIAETVEAWQFGPVVPSVYHEFKHERSGAISSRATEFDLDDFAIIEPSVPAEDSQARAVMDKVWQAYGKLSATQLSNLTHLPDTPWANARAKYGETQRSVPIEEDLIKAHFKAQADKNRSARGQST
jgi:uncharacterized phage-associated protein